MCKKPYGASVTDQASGGYTIVAADGSSNVECYSKDSGVSAAYSTQSGAARIMIRKPAVPQTGWADIQSTKMECWNGGVPTVELPGAAALQFTGASRKAGSGLFQFLRFCVKLAPKFPSCEFLSTRARCRQVMAHLGRKHARRGSGALQRPADSKAMLKKLER